VPLTARQRQRARGLAHHLAPTVTIGRAGLTPLVVDKTREELGHHELVKVKIFADNRSGLLALSDELAARSESDLVQVIGKIAVLYKKRAKKPEIDLGN
jgi:RNA-binding protein